VASVLFDHIALGLPRIADAAPFFAGVLGGVPDGGGPSGMFRWATWAYEGGGLIEVIEPTGDEGFLHRFLTQRGPGVHHVTFKVPSARATCDRARALGLNPVGFDDSDPSWIEAFLHPKESLGIVVQFAESRVVSGGATRPPEPPPGVPDSPPPITLLGLRLRAHSRERADRQWAQILQGVVDESGADEVTYRWPGSPMRLVVELSPGGEEGPLAIEIASTRPVDLPRGPVPQLGAVFTLRGDASGSR
jgi:catechol 2,3-dioxygenase-like lactoylglutathione lyase family enzyme